MILASQVYRWGSDDLLSYWLQRDYLVQKTVQPDLEDYFITIDSVLGPKDSGDLHPFHLRPLLDQLVVRDIAKKCFFVPCVRQPGHYVLYNFVVPNHSRYNTHRLSA